MKRRKLKREVKVILLITILLIVGGVFVNKAINRFDRISHMCDVEKGSTCDLYEVQEYARQLGGK